MQTIAREREKERMEREKERMEREGQRQTER